MKSISTLKNSTKNPTATSKTLTVVLFVLGIGFNAQARDSLWLLCEDGEIAVSVVERRAPSGADRETDFRLLYGAHSFRATLPDSYTDKVNMKSDSSRSLRFVGLVTADFSKSRVTLKGSFVDGADKTAIDRVLSCKELNPNL